MLKSPSPALTRAAALVLVALLAATAACSDDDDAAPSTTARRSAQATTSTAPTTTAPPTTKAPTTQPPTTAAPTTQPPATVESGGFPGASNTGVPPGTRLRPSGTVVVTEPGTVIEGLDITGTLDIRADDVEVRRTRIRTRGDDWTVVGIEEGLTGIVIEDCEIDGLGTSGWPEGGTTGIQGEGVTVRRCDIHSVGDAMKAGSNTVFEDNWVHDLAAAGEPHYDGFQFDGGGENVIVRHNTISMPDQTGAVNIGNTFGPISNVLVEDNLLSGGTYTVYVDAVHGSDPITGVQLINNRFGWHQYGAVLVRNVTLAASSGNVDHETGAPIVID